MTDFHSYVPADGHGLPHDPFNAIVAPRPIGWISSVSAGGKRNLAPYSFFNAFNYRPPIIGFASTGAKDTLANVRETGAFVWNLATRAQGEAMNATSATTDRDEFALTGLDTLPSVAVAPPRVAGSPVQFECRLTQIVQLTDAGGGAIPTWLVLGEVVHVHIDRSLLDDGVYQTARARPILRGGGAGDYFEIGEDAHFVMDRPR
ncbi:Asp/Glu/hydantoin racemase [Sphingomonas sp. Leaf407]|uniref:flavin reductase family protein n=1 Tax=unclassified Sphingomonas TaxID=196159 RepID=UPI0006FBC9EB|nr:MULTISPECIES: flavin reductase family protein [unclassified Sphingomonas]KQN36678.1 Asp/Glu/hydantoin racemase [Sphingomonas sp. Leaf42]KQT27300.1 Asp/Glu/hydantoin racemase [Sphingomonas sp. Leaf407]